MKANYHTHTKRCKHAVGEDREYVEAAIEAGLEVLGFSDHCPWVYRDGFVSSIRMSAEQTEEYFYSLEKLRKEYAGDISIYIGFEAEYIPDLMEDQDKLLAQYPLDYMILGQHFLGHEGDTVYTGRPDPDEKRLQQYVDSVIEALDSGRYLYLAHPDMVNFTGSEEIYEKHMVRLCKYLKEHHVPAELNILGALQGRTYPSPRFLRILKQMGNDCILGVDAHDPKQITEQAGYQKCMEWIEEFGLNCIEIDNPLVWTVE